MGVEPEIGLCDRSGSRFFYCWLPLEYEFEKVLEMYPYSCIFLDMDSSNHFEQNRPVHLAMRDVYYQRATEILIRAEQTCAAGCRIKLYEEILQLLRTARRHARFAARTVHDKNQNDRDFYRYLDLLVGNVKAVLAMLNQKRSVEHAEGFFFSFLGVNHASVVLQAEDYERRANDIIRCIHKTLELALEPFTALRKSNREGSTDAEKGRYKKAYKHYSAVLNLDKNRSPDDSSVDLLEAEI
jgi:tetratricopeptide (TPR) repeat protein